jgi:thiosulfate dehydrogenase (quinone) large subunit
MQSGEVQYLAEPPAARWLFASPAAAWIWLAVRLWLGYEWLHAGASKIWGAESASFWRGGLGLKGFAESAIASSKQPHAAVIYGWWTQFLRDFVVPNHIWIAKLVALGELAIGAALILGMFTGIAAAAGLVLNFTYVFSGALSSNPVFIILGIGLVLAWRNAGLIGVDGYLLPKLGTPWQPRGALLALRRHLPGGKGNLPQMT